MSGSTKGKISDLNLFQRLNFWVVKLGGAILTTPPTLSGVETPSEATIACTSAAFTNPDSFQKLSLRRRDDAGGSSCVRQDLTKLVNR